MIYYFVGINKPPHIISLISHTLPPLPYTIAAARNTVHQPKQPPSCALAAVPTFEAEVIFSISLLVVGHVYTEIILPDALTLIRTDLFYHINVNRRQDRAPKLTKSSPHPPVSLKPNNI